jgi:hypothetical protein
VETNYCANHVAKLPMNVQFLASTREFWNGAGSCALESLCTPLRPDHVSVADEPLSFATRQSFAQREPPPDLMFLPSFSSLAISCASKRETIRGALWRARHGAPVKKRLGVGESGGFNELTNTELSLNLQ